LIVEQLTTHKESFPSQITDIANIHQASLDIHKGQLMRVVFIDTFDYDSRNRLLIIIHHLVVDGVSWRILLEDLERILNALMQGDTPLWEPKTSSVRQWYNALAEYGKSSRLLTQRDYWLTAAQRYRPLPYDHTWPGLIQFKHIGHYTSRLSQMQTQALLQEVPAVYHTEINDILLAALAKTISEWTGASHTVIGLEGHGREDIIDGIDLTHTVGWFTTMYPLSLSRGAASSPAHWIKTVKEQLRKVPDKGLGYGVLKYINNEPQLQGDSPWDIVFNYLGQLDNVLDRHRYLTPAGEPIGDRVNPEGITADKLSVNSMVMGGELVLNWGYSTLHFHHEQIQQLSAAYLANLELLISHCTQQHPSDNLVTPSDYGLGHEIAYDELDSFLQENENTETDTIIDL
jgi:non-ribosomal peptide synthase protein (TIGR01720 family)